MQRILFRDLPGIAAIEQQLRISDKLMRDELDAMAAAIDDASLRLFCISSSDTYHWNLPASADTSKEEWEAHFDFLEWEYDEEEAFWEAFGLDMRDEDGDYLECLSVFGRQLVCALKRIHPLAALTFMPDTPKSDSQLAAEAEAWGRRLRAK